MEAVQKARKVVPMPTLTARNGALAGTVFRLQVEEATLGRRSDCTYVIDDPRVSRIHASLKQETGAFVLTDLGSSGGTKVNGEEVTGSHVLYHGDVIKIGPLELVFEDPSAMSASDEPTIVFDVGEVTTGPTLSPRQQEVLEGMAGGLTNKEIGEKLGVTERTVKAYAQELYDKLGARNRAGAVAEATKLGLLEL